MSISEYPGNHHSSSIPACEIDGAGKTRDRRLVGLVTVGLGLFLLVLLSRPAQAQESVPSPILPPGSTVSEPESASAPVWRYGAYVDLTYPLDFNFPGNHVWRSKSTTQRVNEFNVNMALAYVRKEVSGLSGWGMEFALQTGRDAEGQVPNASLRRGSPYDNADAYSHFSRANVSYLAPVGTGLTLTAGLFNSFIGYESFYAKDNPNYTRTFMADYSPYFMFGLSAQYRINEVVKTAFYVINRYDYLSYSNNLPSYGAQINWSAAPHLTVIQNLYYGPDQSNTSMQYWRFFSDSIIEWKRDALTLAAAYDIGMERAIPQAGGQRVFWTAGAVWARWQVAEPWAVALRPELYYDPDGTMTGARQFIKGLTTTLEYRLKHAWTTTRFLLEYRFNNSTGSQGGFYTEGQTASGAIGLTPSQNLLLFSILWSLDSR